MIKARCGKWNDHYKITSFVKPNAPSSVVLNTCNNLIGTFKKDDIIVISVGSNDCNPYILFTNLCNTLNYLKDHKVYVINVKYNPSLNERKLNGELKLLIRNFDNCDFIHVDYKKYNFPAKTAHLDSICFKLNIEIDFLEYKTKFIQNAFKKRSHVLKSKNYKQKSILHYFPVIGKTNTSANSQPNTPLQRFFRAS